MYLQQGFKRVRTLVQGRRRILLAFALMLALAMFQAPVTQAWLICNCVALQAFQARGEEAEQLVILAGQKFYEARAHYATALAQFEDGKLAPSLTSLTQAIEALSQSIRLYKTVIRIGEMVGIKPSYIEALQKVDYPQLGYELQAKPELWQVITQLGREGNVLGFFKEGIGKFEQNRAFLEDLYGTAASGLLLSITDFMQVSASLHETTLFGIYTSALAMKVSTDCQER